MQAKKARKVMISLGTPTPEDLKAMIRMNLIRNNELTIEDVNIAIKSFGPDVGTIKGKTTRQKPSPVIENHIEIPEEVLPINREVTMFMYGLSVNSLKFLATISNNILYRTA